MLLGIDDSMVDVPQPLRSIDSQYRRLLWIEANRKSDAILWVYPASGGCDVDRDARYNLFAAGVHNLLRPTLNTRLETLTGAEYGLPVTILTGERFDSNRVVQETTETHSLKSAQRSNSRLSVMGRALFVSVEVSVFL